MINGRITKGIGGLYTVDTENGIYLCGARGVFRLENITPLVGDFVQVEVNENEENTGTIWIIEDRKTSLIRPKVANCDQAVLVFAFKKPNLNMDLLDRFIISCERQNVEPVICFNKIDILKEKDMNQLDEINERYQKAGFITCKVSAYENTGIDALRERLTDKVSVFAGPSGAGKSSIINIIYPNANMETGILSQKIGRGKHTTRHTELIKIGENDYILDSPGFTSLYLENIAKEDLKKYFREFKQHLGKCKFLDCNHMDEPDCAVKQAVEKGNISKERYNRYQSIFNEISNKG